MSAAVREPGVASSSAKTMQAFATQGLCKVGLVEKKLPPLGSRDALVRTTAALLCSSDVHAAMGALGARHNLTLGRAAVGRIERLGSEVSGFHVGQRVAVGSITPCWRCANCQSGHPAQCGRALGGWKSAHTKDGSLAEFFAINDAQANMAVIPDTVPDEAAVYVSDMSTGLAGAENAAIPTGGTVAIFGLGPIGLLATAFARLLGAGSVLGVETVPARQALARQFGADEIIDFRLADPPEVIRRLTDGQGVDSTIEAVGSAESFANCIRATRPGGTICNVGYHAEGEAVPIPRLDWGVGLSDQTIRTALCPGGGLRLERLLRLLANKRIDPTPLTTHRFAFSEVEKAFHLLASRSDGILKPLIVF